MSVLAIIQARTGSTRLSGKVLKLIEGKTVLEHVYNRVKQSKLIDAIVIAIPKGDIKLIELCKHLNISYFEGHESDVLTRYYECAKYYKYAYSYIDIYYDNIVRITADCCLICFEIIDTVIENHLKFGLDYSSNRLPGRGTFPDGTDVEVFKSSILEQAYKNAIGVDRLHVTPWMISNSKISKYILNSPIDYSSKRWTLDTEDDLWFIRAVYRKLYKEGQYFGFNEIIELLNQYPEFENINSGHVRDEGYFKDLNNE